MIEFLSKYPKPILSKLSKNNLIPEELFEKYKDLFTSLDIDFGGDKNYDWDEWKNNFTKSSSPSGFFKVWISKYTKDHKFYDIKPLVKSIKENYKTIHSNNSNVIFISVEDLDDFLSEFKDLEKIHWWDFCRETNIPWSNELIAKYQNLWDWEYLHRNPSVNWNFDLIENNIEYLNWSYISSYPSLKWDVNKLLKYKDHLIFATDNDNYRVKSQILCKNKIGQAARLKEIRSSVRVML